MPRPNKQIWMIVIALALLVAFFAPAAEARGHKLVVEMDEPFEVDGHIYPAGQLSVHDVGDYSPVATFNEIRVDGKSLGVVVARELRTSRVAMNDALIFTRADGGHLVLQSVSLKGQPTRELELADPVAAEMPSVPTGRLQAAAVRP